MGSQDLVVGGGAQTLEAPTETEYGRLCAGLERVVEIAARHGLTASFHPHMTTIVERAAQIERALAGSSIGLCPDTGHVLLAGDDPAALIRAWAERIRYVHIKDVDLRTGQFVPLGSGVLDLPAVMQALEDIGYDGWTTVELDAWPDPAEGARRNRLALESWVPAASSANP